MSSQYCVSTIVWNPHSRLYNPYRHTIDPFQRHTRQTSTIRKHLINKLPFYLYTDVQTHATTTTTTTSTPSHWIHFTLLQSLYLHSLCALGCFFQLRQRSYHQIHTYTLAYSLAPKLTYRRIRGELLDGTTFLFFLSAFLII